MGERPRFNFDRSKPFYPLVINYLVSLFSIKEMMARYVVALLRDRLNDPLSSLIVHSNVRLGWNDPADVPEMGKLFETFAASGIPEHWALNAAAIELMPSLSLRSRERKPLGFVLDEIVAELGLDPVGHLEAQLGFAGSLLVMAFESTDAFHDKGPLWEFLRHCRNAAAHGGRFTFIPGQPSRPAKWGELVIDRGLEGTRLFQGNSEQGLIYPGDPLYLLWDIEQAYPGMKLT